MRIEGTMFNPFSGQVRPEIVVTAKSTSESLRRNEDPATFFASEVVLETRHPQGLLRYRDAVIHPLTPRRVAPGADWTNEQVWAQQIRVPAIIDPGTTTIDQIVLFSSTNAAAAEPSDFIAHAAVRDPLTGRADVVLTGAELGAPPFNLYSGPLRYFWYVRFSVEGTTHEITSGVRQITVDLNMPFMSWRNLWGIVPSGPAAPRGRTGGWHRPDPPRRAVWRIDPARHLWRSPSGLRGRARLRETQG